MSEEVDSALQGICPICKKIKDLHDSSFNLNDEPRCEECWDISPQINKHTQKEKNENT